MNRRGFITSLLASASASVAATYDIERLLWIPGEKHISIPKRPVFCVSWSHGMIEKVHSDYAEWTLRNLHNKYDPHKYLSSMVEHEVEQFWHSGDHYVPLSFYNSLLRPARRKGIALVRTWTEYE